MAEVTLREYQSRSINEVRACVRRRIKRILLTVPTGGGKTLTSAAILAAAVAKGSRVLFVAHRKELIDQTCKTFHRLGVTSFGVIRAKDIRTDPTQPIQICSIQTLARRGRVEGVKIVVIDEAHRSVANSYRKHLFEAYPDAIFIGLTATPIRGDGKPLGTDWSELVIGARYSELIAGGHIDEPLVYSTPMLPDLSRVHTVAGDYDQEELEAAVNRGALIGDLLAQWQKRSEGRRTVAFAVSVAHSKAIVAMFREAGIAAEHLDGTTPETEREAILRRLEDGTTRVVSNVGVLCEGWDMPSCKCLLLARPTKSLGLYMQMGGRILRPSGQLPVILDHAGNFDRHGPPHADREWTLSDKVKPACTAPTKLCKACFAYIARSVGVCPHCGYEYTKAQLEIDLRPPEPEIVSVDLQLRTCTGDDAKLAFFRATAKEAEKKGWKPIAITMRYRERFHQKPPSEWTLTVRNAYQGNKDWQALDKARDPMRESFRADKERVAS